MMDVLAAAPVAIVRIGSNGRIDWVNDAAFDLVGCSMGQDLRDCIHADALARFDQLADIPGDTADVRLKGQGGSRVASVVAVDPGDGARYFFFSDVSERVALSRQLRATQEPGRKLLHQLHTANATMTGYAELIAVMLDEEDVLEGERMTVVRRYHKEIRRCQQALDRLLKIARHGGKRPDSGTAVPINRRHIVVIDDEAAIADYITELMKGLQHKVTTFTEPGAALEFTVENAESIDLVITDHTMPTISGLDLASRVHATRESLPVLICPEQELTFREDEQLFQCQKPLDINELIQIVSDLV